jgi:hypothetical protein
MRGPRAAIVLGLLAGVLSGQMQLTLADGTTTRGSFGGIAADGSLTWQGPGGAVKFPAGQAVSIDVPEGAQAPGEEAFRVDLVTGDTLIGRIEDGSADDLRLRAPSFGDLTVPLDDVAIIWNLQFPRGEDTLPAPKGKGETLYVDRDGRLDAVDGTLDRISKGQVMFTSSAGAKRGFQFVRDRVVALRMAAGANPAPAKPGVSILRLKDGSRLSGALEPSDGAAFSMKLTAGIKVTVDARSVRSLAISSASLRWLSDLDPSSFTETPLIQGGLLQGLHRDRGLKSGQPLRIGRRTFSKGVLVPARARLTYAIDGSWARLIATAGIDGATEGVELAGSAKATVSVDGKTVWTGTLKAGRPPESIDAGGLAGARELAIEVDFADSFDCGARVVLGNAMLVK